MAKILKKVKHHAFPLVICVGQFLKIDLIAQLSERESCSQQMVS